MSLYFMMMPSPPDQSENANKPTDEAGELTRVILSAVTIVLFMAIICYLIIIRINSIDSSIDNSIDSSIDSGPLLEIVNVSTDKDLYHSAEVMTFKVLVYAVKDFEDVNVTANGIVNRLNATRIVNLTEGVSEVPFVYTLPRCNVCGGIRAGYYNITGGVVYGNISLASYEQITILQ